MLRQLPRRLGLRSLLAAGAELIRGAADWSVRLVVVWQPTSTRSHSVRSPFLRTLGVTVMGPSFEICPILGSHFPRVNRAGRGHLSHVAPRHDAAAPERPAAGWLNYVRICPSMHVLRQMSRRRGLPRHRPGGSRPRLLPAPHSAERDWSASPGPAWWAG